MPRLRTAEDLTQIDASPCKRLIAAMLRQAVGDARAGNTHSEGARDWLRNEGLVRWWLDLAGLPDTAYFRLLRAAGLEE